MGGWSNRNLAELSTSPAYGELSSMMISYGMPGRAEQGLKELGELVASYQGLRENGARGPSIVSASIACARRCNLDKDIKDLPEDDVDAKQMTLEVNGGRGIWSERGQGECLVG